MKEKFVKKYMRIARQIAYDNDSCYSRQIGVVIVNPDTNTICGTGYNGPPAGTPHCDDQNYLENFFWPQLTQEEREIACENVTSGERVMYTKQFFSRKAANCKTCPRRLVNAGPGERSTLCSCQHAERNAIYNANCSVYGCYIFCWCGIPCIDCTGAIINAGIKDVYCLKAPIYHNSSEYLFEEANVPLNIYEKDFFD